MLDHERLHVYQRAIELLARVLTVLPKLPRGHAKLSDQLWRSASSIPANIAEGVGKRSLVERRSYYDHARGSAFETAAHLDVVRLLGHVEEDVISRAKKDVEEIVRMLSALLREE
jgi:four helix bundle protein